MNTQPFEDPRQEWLAVLGRLWTAIGKDVDTRRLSVYEKELGIIPLALLDQAVSRAIRDNGEYQTVPTIGKIWSALRVELHNPFDIAQAIEEWEQARWNKVVDKYGAVV